MCCALNLVQNMSMMSLQSARVKRAQKVLKPRHDSRYWASAPKPGLRCCPTVGPLSPHCRQLMKVERENVAGKRAPLVHCLSCKFEALRWQGPTLEKQTAPESTPMIPALKRERYKDSATLMDRQLNQISGPQAQWKTLPQKLWWKGNKDIRCQAPAYSLPPPLFLSLSSCLPLHPSLSPPHTHIHTHTYAHANMHQN